MKVFYYSDHHWDIVGAAKGAEILAERLNRDYGCQYDLQYFQPKSFYKEKYKRLSIGGQGKKLTQMYMHHCKKEDFTVWYPCFKTDFTYEVARESKQSGPYKILYDVAALNTNAYVTINYGLFHSGDLANLKIINHRVPEQIRKKILVVKDSFANPLVLLLALQTYEIHEIDPRHSSAPDIGEYIKKEKPDIVIFLMQPSI